MSRIAMLRGRVLEKTEFSEVHRESVQDLLEWIKATIVHSKKLQGRKISKEFDLELKGQIAGLEMVVRAIWLRSARDESYD